MTTKADKIQTALIRELQRSIVKLRTEFVALRLSFDKMEAELHLIGREKQRLVESGDALLSCIAAKERNESDSQAIASWRLCKSVVMSMKKAIRMRR